MRVSTRTLVAAAIFAVVGPPEGGHYVRAAAAQGPEALRRYIWRTQGIYNFYYDDFAPRA